MAWRPKARSECRELAKNAGGLRSVAGDAADSSEGRQGADGSALTVFERGPLERISIAVTKAE